MEEKQIDRRIRRTKRQLRLGLLQLLQEKPVQDISVREITELADLNRGTFYLHYRDVFDMLEQIENETLRELQEIFDAYPTHREGPSALLHEIFLYLADNKDLAQALLGTHGNRSFFNKMRGLIRDNCFANWTHLYNKQKADNFEPFYAFVLSGCMGLLQSWLEAAKPKAPEEMAHLTESIICQGINVLA